MYWLYFEVELCYVKTCLDIGCGKDELSSMLSRQSEKVIAVDLADQMIETAKDLDPN